MEAAWRLALLAKAAVASSYLPAVIGSRGFLMSPAEKYPLPALRSSIAEASQKKKDPVYQETLPVAAFARGAATSQRKHSSYCFCRGHEDHRAAN